MGKLEPDLEPGIFGIEDEAAIAAADARAEADFAAGRVVSHEAVLAEVLGH